MQCIELSRRFFRPWLFLIALGISMLLSPMNVRAVTLSSPVGGEIIPSGTVRDIVWSPDPADLTFTLKYSLNYGVTWTTAKDESGKTAVKVSGTTFAWKVPVVPNNKRGCLIKVIAYGTTGRKSCADKSDAPFTVEVARLTSPNGKEGQRLIILVVSAFLEEMPPVVFRVALRTS